MIFLFPVCGSESLADVMFLYDALSIGAYKTNLISKFVSQVTKSLDVRTGHVRIGKMLYSCLDDAYTALTSPEDIHIWGNTVLPGITDLLNKLRTSGFSRENGDRQDAKNIAVLFVDGVLHDMNQVQEHIATMSHVNFVTVVIGGNNMQFDGALKVQSYEDLSNFKADFLGRLCPALNVIEINLPGIAKEI